MTSVLAGCTPPSACSSPNQAAKAAKAAVPPAQMAAHRHRQVGAILNAAGIKSAVFTPPQPVLAAPAGASKANFAVTNGVPAVTPGTGAVTQAAVAAAAASAQAKGAAASPASPAAAQPSAVKPAAPGSQALAAQKLAQNKAVAKKVAELTHVPGFPKLPKVKLTKKARTGTRIT